MARSSMNLVLDPVLRFRVLRARDGVVVLEVYPVVADDDLPRRLELREGDIWMYALTLNAEGWHQHNDVKHEGGAPALPEPRRLLGRRRER